MHAIGSSPDLIWPICLTRDERADFDGSIRFGNPILYRLENNRLFLEPLYHQELKILVFFTDLYKSGVPNCQSKID